MVRIHTRINLRDYSRATHLKGTVSLCHTNDLSSGLIHISIGDGVPVVIHWSRVPQSLRSRGGRGLTLVWWDHQNLVGFRVNNSVDQSQHSRKKLRKQPLRGPHQEELIGIPIQIA